MEDYRCCIECVAAFVRVLKIVGSVLKHILDGVLILIVRLFWFMRSTELRGCCVAQIIKASAWLTLRMPDLFVNLLQELNSLTAESGCLLKSTLQKMNAIVLNVFFCSCAEVCITKFSTSLSVVTSVVFLLIG